MAYTSNLYKCDNVHNSTSNGYGHVYAMYDLDWVLNIIQCIPITLCASQCLCHANLKLEVWQCIFPGSCTLHDIFVDEAHVYNRCVQIFIYFKFVPSFMGPNLTNVCIPQLIGYMNSSYESCILEMHPRYWYVISNALSPSSHTHLLPISWWGVLVVWGSTLLGAHVLGNGLSHFHVERKSWIGCPHKASLLESPLHSLSFPVIMFKFRVKEFFIKRRIICTTMTCLRIGMSSQMVPVTWTLPSSSLK